MKKYVVLTSLLFSSVALAESTIISTHLIKNNQAEQGWVDRLLEKLGASNHIDVSQGIDWGVLPGPFANPQQGVGLGIAAIGLYAPKGWTEGMPYSSLSVKSFISSTGSFGIGLENRTYLEGDDLRVFGDLWLTQQPNDYWGVGKKAGENQNNKVEYKSSVFQFAPKIAYQVYPRIYLSAGFDLQSIRKLSIKRPLLTKEQLRNQRSNGVSLGIEYDSRDFELNATEGTLLSIQYANYLKALGSTSRYQNLIINYRQYVRLGKNDVLAWDFWGQRVSGNVPWFAYAELGNSNRMRGYYTGQYRDSYLLTGQVELRHHITGRHGVVVFLGAGNVASSVSKLFHTGFLPNYGVGYRFAFKPRVNIRLDFGMGKNTHGFYFNINEAF